METFLLGIDEAGRGPVIGPMVVAGVLVDKDTQSKMTDAGVRDSKVLSPKKREQFYSFIMDHSLWNNIQVIWPDKIDQYIDTDSLNILECEVMSSIVNSCSDFGPIKVFIDSPQTPSVFKDMICTRLNRPDSYDIDCRFKADRDIVVVAAASILAKVMRDRIIEELHEQFGDFGSGYPSDPKTKNFMSKCFSSNSADSIIRKSWKTYREPTFWN